MSVVYRYGRVTVTPGKHGPGDYRASFAGQSPTHGELLAILWWVFKAEDRYPKFGRRLLWAHIQRVFGEDTALEDILRDADGTDDANWRLDRLARRR